MRAYPLHETVARARDLSEADRQAMAEDLRRVVRGQVRSDRFSRLLYATDASIYQMEPVAVVFPEGVEDVQATLRLAARGGVPVLPRGGGTGLSGQTVNHAIVLDFTPKMGQVLEINRDEAWARVQPGVVLAELNRQAARQGMLYAIDPSTANRATIGGGLANNSCGAHSILYGKSIDQMLSLESVLSDASRARFEAVDGPALDAKLRLDNLEGEIYREVRRIGREQREEIAARYPTILRRVSGYNLDDFVHAEGPMDVARMLVGSEGTLAVITEAKVKLQSAPRLKAIAAVHFHSVVEAAEATVAALEHEVSSIELVDDTIVQRCRMSTGFRKLAEFVVGDPGAILFIEFYGDSEAETLAKLDRLQADLTRKGLGYATVTTTDPAVQREWWRMREAGLGLLMSVRGDTKPIAYVEDTAVAPEKLPEFIRRFQQIVESNGTQAAYYGHASVGCLHIRPAVNIKTAEGLRTMEAISTEIADLVLEFGGSLSGEHGDGILRGVFTERMFGPRLTGAFREVKHAFDPRGLLNPGKIIDTPAFGDNLRLGPETRNWEPVTYLDFGTEGGMARAAEQCNGQGACRKHDGVMCPSYMVTLDEEHSTRGRANLLRMAFSGAVPHAELTGDRMIQALDLCVECKGCKAECPSGVDMAKLKYEVLAQRGDTLGVPLRARLFANIATLSRYGSRFGALANLGARIGPARALLQRFGGIHRERPLPSFASETFSHWWRRHSGSLTNLSAAVPHPNPLPKGEGSRRETPSSEEKDTAEEKDFISLSPGESAVLSLSKEAGVRGTAPRGDAVLFADTFTDYYHPEVGRAAVHVLEALGYNVIVVPRTVCCGRPAISKGLLPTARDWARRNVEVLLPYAERGTPIVGTEPSCILTFREEYIDLLRDEPSRTVAARTFLLDELLALLATEGEDVSAIFRDDLPREVLLHAHCHQKAGVGADVTLRALDLVPGYRVRLIDSTCCGMAGSFGFEAEHYEISRAMGARRLFPAVEASSPDTAIAITGVSCRQQIGHFTSRRPRHSVELLADALK